MTDAQKRMMRKVAANEKWYLELSQIVMECAEAYEGGLAWRIADRTAGALLRRGWIRLDGDVPLLTPEGRAALAPPPAIDVMAALKSALDHKFGPADRQPQKAQWR